MIQEKELKSASAGQFAWAAARDANRYSDECRMLYTNVRRELTYRKSFVVVKIEKGQGRDRAYARMVEDEAAERGYVRTVTPQSVNYRITF